MLSRYQIARGRRLTDLPARVRNGRRMDTRKHTRHLLRPTAAMVESYLRSPSDTAWRKLERDYLALLRRRAEADPTAFDELHELAKTLDVFLGCSCPTALNPDPQRCHTVLALRFMAERYPDLAVQFP